MKKPGSVGVVGVSSKLSDAEIQAVVSQLQAHFSVEPQLSEALFSWGTPETRAAHFLAMAGNEAISFVWCARGGEGCADLMPFLEQARADLTASPKTILGMSDNTPLLLFLASCGWNAFYGPVASYLSRELMPRTKAGLSAVFSGEFPQVLLRSLNQAAREVTQLDGEVSGGNLTLLSISLREYWEFHPAGKIVILEDWNEPAFAVDRTLKYFERIGKFDGVKAVIFGEFDGNLPSSLPALPPANTVALAGVFERFSERMNARGCPVFQAPHVGHLSETCPVFLGKSSIIPGASNGEFFLCGISPFHGGGDERS